MFRSLILLPVLTLLAGAAPATEPVADVSTVQYVETTVTAQLAKLGPLADKHRAMTDFKWLTTQEIAELEAGDMVFREVEVSGNPVPRLTIAQVLDLPVEAVYLVVGDPSRSTEWTPNLSHSIPLTNGTTRSTLQYLEAPYPAQDRGWITKMHNNKDLYQASGGEFWEVWWRLEPEMYKDFLVAAGKAESKEAKKLPSDLSAEILLDSATLGEGTGAWSLIPLGSHKTLVCYQNFSNPNANAIEAAVVGVLGGRLQKGIFEQLEPIARSYAKGESKPPKSMVDMMGGSSEALWQLMLKR